MSKIRAYYSTVPAWLVLFNSPAFLSYVSNDPYFWISTYGNNDYVLIFVNGDDRDHTVFPNQTGIHSADFDDIRAGIETQTPTAIITKAINNIAGLTLTDFIGALTVREVFTVIIQHLSPGQKSLSFDNPPNLSGTFTDNFADTDGVLLQNHTPSGGGTWTLGKNGGYAAEIDTDRLKFTTGGGGSGFSYWLNTDQGNISQYNEAYDYRFSASFDEIYLAIALVDEANFFGYHLAGTGSAGARLVKMLSGTLTDSLNSVSTQGGNGYGFRPWRSSSTLRLYRDIIGDGTWVQQGTDYTIVDSVFDSATRAGFVVNEASVGIKFDNYANGLVGAPPAGRPLPQRVLSGPFVGPLGGPF